MLNLNLVNKSNQKVLVKIITDIMNIAETQVLDIARGRRA